MRKRILLLISSVCLYLLSVGCVRTLPLRVDADMLGSSPQSQNETPPSFASPSSPIPISKQSPGAEPISSPSPSATPPGAVTMVDSDQQTASVAEKNLGYEDVFTLSRAFELTFADSATRAIHVSVSLSLEEQALKLFRETPVYRRMELVDDLRFTREKGRLIFELDQPGRHLATIGAEQLAISDQLTLATEENATESIVAYPNDTSTSSSTSVQLLRRGYSQDGLPPDRVVRDFNDRRIGYLCMSGYNMENGAGPYAGFGRFLKYATTQSPRYKQFVETFKPAVFKGISSKPIFENARLALSSQVYKDARPYVLFCYSKGGLDGRTMRAIDFASGRKSISGLDTAGTPHHGSTQAIDEEFQAGVARLPGSLALNIAHILTTTQNFGGLRSSLNNVPLTSLLNKPRGRLHSEGFNDLAYDGTAPGIPVLAYKLQLVGGLEVSRRLSPSSMYVSQCNKSTIFTYPASVSANIKQFFDENGNCYYNYVQALSAFEQAIGIQNEKDMFVHAGYRDGTGLTQARDAFLLKVFRPGGLNSIAQDAGSEARKLGQDFLTTELAAQPIATPKKVSDFAANDSLVALHSGLNSIPSELSLIHQGLSSYDHIVLDDVALELRKSPRTIGQYAWKKRHSELLGMGENDSAGIDPRDIPYYELHMDHAFYFADMIRKNQLSTLSPQDHKDIESLVRISFETSEKCSNSAGVTYCGKNEVTSCCSAALQDGNTATITFTVESSTYKSGLPPHWSNELRYFAALEKIGGQWEWWGYWLE